MPPEIQDAYHLLGLQPGTPLNQVKRAYRDHIQFWHPDKHTDKPERLRRLAEEKTKQLNHAYETLTHYLENAETPRPQRPHQHTYNEPQPEPPHQPPYPKNKIHKYARLIPAAAIAIILILLTLPNHTQPLPPALITWLTKNNYTSIHEQDNDGDAPLHLASAIQSTDIAHLLLTHGADQNIQNKSGGTPLHTAALFEHTETVRLLLDRGADPNIQDNDGSTPLDYAIKHNHLEIIRLLRAHGAH